MPVLAEKEGIQRPEQRLQDNLKLRLVEQPEGLGCVLVNEHGNSIHAWVKEADVEDVLGNITEGHVYEITKFSTMDNQRAHKVVPHEAQLLFNNKTVFKLITEEVLAIPIHCFHLMEYNELPHEKTTTPYCQDSNFTCIAKITKILFREGWYYFACPTCKVKLQMGYDSALNIYREYDEQVGVPM
ncbi:hypothetical protein ACLB2K_060137 [Fragaria x ananassa]